MGKYYVSPNDVGGIKKLEDNGGGKSVCDVTLYRVFRVLDDFLWAIFHENIIKRGSKIYEIMCPNKP